MQGTCIYVAHKFGTGSQHMHIITESHAVRWFSTVIEINKKFMKIHEKSMKISLIFGQKLKIF